MRAFCNINSLELTMAITAIANAISCGLSVDELAVASGIFVQIGDTLATIAAQRSLCEDNEAVSSNN